MATISEAFMNVFRRHCVFIRPNQLNAKGETPAAPVVVFSPSWHGQTETHHPQDGSAGLLHLLWAAPPGLDCRQAKVAYFDSPALVQKNI